MITLAIAHQVIVFDSLVAVVNDKPVVQSYKMDTLNVVKGTKVAFTKSDFTLVDADDAISSITLVPAVVDNNSNYTVKNNEVTYAALLCSLTLLL